MIDILERITQYREKHHWTEYELAKRAELPQSTISSWYRKNMLPSIASLDKIAQAYGLTLSQFFIDLSISKLILFLTAPLLQTYLFLLILYYYKFT